MKLIIKNAVTGTIVGSAAKVIGIVESSGMRRVVADYKTKDAFIDISDEHSFDDHVVSMKVVEKLTKKLAKAGFETAIEAA